MVIQAHPQMTISVKRSPENSVDYVRILGEPDLADSTQLGLAARQIIDDGSDLVYVDLGGTSFMGSTLVAFLIHIADSGAGDRALVLCRPSPIARRVIELTHLDDRFAVRDELPPDWPADGHGDGSSPDTAPVWERYDSI
jgi:anti-anti-sigma factor